MPPSPSAQMAIYTCSGQSNSLPPLLCNILFLLPIITAAIHWYEGWRVFRVTCVTRVSRVLTRVNRVTRVTRVQNGRCVSLGERHQGRRRRGLWH